MRGLSEGWILTSLGEIGQWGSGGTPSRKNHEYFGSGIPWIKSGDLPDGPILRTEEQITELGLKNSSAKLMPAGTISIAMYGATIGKLGLLTFPAATNQACANVIPQSQLIDRDYLFFYLLSERQALIDKGQGGAQPNISQEVIKAHPIVIAPLAEQRRIVAKLKPPLGKVDAYQQRLEKIPVILKRFRQAVLAAVCAGRLTAKWREEHPDAEPVFPLLQEIGADNQNDLPESWAIGSVGDTISGLKYGTSQKCSYEKGGIPVLRIPNIGEGVIDQSDLKYADLPANELDQLKLHPGDVLLIRSNGSVSLVGRAALVRDSEKGFAYAGYLIRLRPNTSRILPPYLNLVLGIRDVRLQIEIPARSTSGVNNINSDEVKALKIPLPPLAEQAEIVRHVETLFKLADQIEARYQKAKQMVDKLPQLILAKAFRGELVLTEAELARREGRDYEPASVLLERIRSERAELAQGRKEKAGSQMKPIKGKVSGVAISKS